MVDIARPESVKRQKKIRRAIYGASRSSRSSLISVGVSRLKPAAPGVDRATVWIDTVKRGPMTRQVRGSGTLIPEDIRWIPATTQGRVERILLRPGAEVKPDTVILEMSNPDLQQSVKDAQLAFQSAQAAFLNKKADLESQFLSQQADAATIEANYSQAAAGPRSQRAAAEGRARFGADGQVEADAGQRPGRTASRSPSSGCKMTRGGPQVAAGAAGSGRQPEARRLRAEHAQARRPARQGRHDGRAAAGPVEVGAQVQPGRPT